MNTNTSAQTPNYELVRVTSANGGHGGWNIRNIRTGRIVLDSCGSARWFSSANAAEYAVTVLNRNH